MPWCSANKTMVYARGTLIDHSSSAACQSIHEMCECVVFYNAYHAWSNGWSMPDTYFHGNVIYRMGVWFKD
jgi:hypothetical protein